VNYYYYYYILNLSFSPPELDPSRVCKGKGAVTLRATRVHIDDEGRISTEPSKSERLCGTRADVAATTSTLLRSHTLLLACLSRLVFMLRNASCLSMNGRSCFHVRVKELDCRAHCSVGSSGCVEISEPGERPNGRRA